MAHRQPTTSAPPPPGRAPGRRGRPPSGVRDKVLAAAEATLTQAGIARFSTKEIARHAGVAESSICYQLPLGGQPDRAGEPYHTADPTWPQPSLAAR